MVREFFQRALRRTVIRLTNKYSSRPVKERVYDALTALYAHIQKEPGKKGLYLQMEKEDKFIIFSDQHKGARNYADDFALAERNYIAALSFYNDCSYQYISLGDSEELWENLLDQVIKHNKETFEAEKLLLQRQAFIKIFGNHDLYWDNDPLAQLNLHNIYGEKLKIYEGAILKADINGNDLHFFLTHGHQGDLQSDGNWFSKWFVSTIWAPLQAYLMINPNTPAYDDQLKSDHNRLMYEWSSMQKNIILITGHTHQPIFASLTHLERIYRQLNRVRELKDVSEVSRLEKELNSRIRKDDLPPDFTSYKPNYFNTGCCCFDDGDITGIEIADGKISLVKWEYNDQNISVRIVLEETDLETLLEQNVEAIVPTISHL
ncbi:MAG TPA: metallophosphoesterase [Sphingobacteriaceae bacterium]|nr:metallophosphoesterase [Sphingobacteriaceae bacterium]